MKKPHILQHQVPVLKELMIEKGMLDPAEENSESAFAVALYCLLRSLMGESADQILADLERVDLLKRFSN